MSENNRSMLNTHTGSIFRTALSGADEVAILVDPTAEMVEEFVGVAADMDSVPQLRVLGEKRAIKSAMDDFKVSSAAADLIDAGRLSVAVDADPSSNSLLVTDRAVVALVEAGSAVGGLSTDDEGFVEAALDAYGAAFETADEFSLRTPPLSRVREQLGEDIGPETAGDFDAMLDSLETARGNGEGLDEVTLSLLAAAKNEVLLYDISRWGEDVGIASKATFSRTKTELEELGLIETEKVPIDVGRPRLRLKLADDRLRTADGAQIASVAQSLIN